MTNHISKVTDFLRVTGEVDKDKVPDINDNEQVDRLTCQVEQTNLEAAKKSPYCALEDLMESWKEKGSAGDTCPRTLMATACSVQDKGYKPVCLNWLKPNPGRSERTQGLCLSGLLF